MTMQCPRRCVPAGPWRLRALAGGRAQAPARGPCCLAAPATPALPQAWGLCLEMVDISGYGDAAYVRQVARRPVRCHSCCC